MWPALFFLLAASPEQRAIEFLSREVPRWQSENHCYSCHNNGDGARALYAARRAGYKIEDVVLADTARWLSRPAEWEHTNGTPGFNNALLARIQFAAALAEAGATATQEAARLLVAAQASDGSWPIDTHGAEGAPATYGTALATYMARRTLEASGGYGDAVARANRWFETTRPSNSFESSVFALARRQRFRPTAKPVEPFDAAIALLAFNAAGQTDEAARIREWLIAKQQPDGSWMETTRPPGQISYAEHISTTAWVLYALLDNPKRH